MAISPIYRESSVPRPSVSTGCVSEERWKYPSLHRTLLRPCSIFFAMIYSFCPLSIVFLKGDCTGGGTHFPWIPRPEHPNWCQYIDCETIDTGTVFKSIAGAAVFWVNTREDGTGFSETLHAGLPEKDVLVTQQGFQLLQLGVYHLASRKFSMNILRDIASSIPKGSTQ